MIDLDATLADMLAGIEWRPQRGHLSLSDLADVRVCDSPQCHLSFEWRPTELDIVALLFCLYVKKFPHTSFDSLYHDLGLPLKHGTGNAVKRGNGNDHGKSILYDHYFTKCGVVVAITDQGMGFDFRKTYSLLERKKKYFTHAGSGFNRFAKCRSKISFQNGGRTLLVQYRAELASQASSRECFASVADGPPPFEIVESLPKPSVNDVYKIARFDPELLRAVWKSSKFVERYIYSALPDARRLEQAERTTTAEIVSIQNTAMTIRYRVADDLIDAKFFSQGDQGARSFEILRAAWREGLGKGQLYQAPRPLAYHADRRLLVTTAINGAAVDLSLAGDIDELVRACQNAARWLLRFHAIPPETVAHRGTCRDVLGKSRSAGAAPSDEGRTLKRSASYTDLLRDMWSEQEQRAETERQRTHAFVPIHGKFTPENILFADGVTYAINFYRSRLGAPAFDLARFAFQLWKRIFKETGEWQRAEIAANAFLTEYGSENPENLASLPYYWGQRILKSFAYYAGHAQQHGLNESLDQVVRFHEAQFKFAGGWGADMVRQRRPSETLITGSQRSLTSGRRG